MFATTKVRPQRLLQLAATINTRYGHASRVQSTYLDSLKPRKKCRSDFSSRYKWRKHLKKTGVFARIKREQDERNEQVKQELASLLLDVFTDTRNNAGQAAGETA